MSVRPSRAVRSSWVAAVAVAVALVAGCSGQTQPGEYNAAYEANLMFGCTGVQPNADGEYENPTLAPVSYCECLYDGLKEKVPFKDAEEFEKQQAEEEAGEIEVPQDIQAVYDDCAKER